MRRKAEATLLDQICILLMKALCCDGGTLQQEQGCVKARV